MCVFRKTQHSFTLLHIPLFALTDRQHDRDTNTLAVRGLEELFFQLCCCVSFLVSVIGFLVGNRFWYYLLTYLEYNTVVALS
jgi:hypothetical protein